METALEQQRAQTIGGDAKNSFTIEGLELPALPDDLCGKDKSNSSPEKTENSDTTDKDEDEGNARGPRLIEHEWRHSVLRLDLVTVG